MDHFIISCTNLHLKYLHWLFVSCRVLALPLSTSEKIKNSNFLSDLKRQAQFLFHKRSEIIPSLPRTLFASPWIKCINISSSLTWRAGWDIWSSWEHFGPKLINAIKYLASPGYQISACVSAVTAIISVYMFISLPTFLAILLISLLSPDMTPSLLSSL